MRSRLAPNANVSFTAELLVKRSIGKDIKSTARRSSIVLWRWLLEFLRVVWHRVLRICGIPGMISILRRPWTSFWQLGLENLGLELDWLGWVAAGFYWLLWIEGYSS